MDDKKENKKMCFFGEPARGHSHTEQAMEATKKIIIHINAPPQDHRCEVCGREAKDLKPFGKAGDPLVGDFNGSILVKTYRSMAMPVTDKTFLKLQKEYEKKEYKGFEEALIKAHGKEKADQILFTDQLACTVEASWECRDCIILDDLQYLRKLYETREKEAEQEAWAFNSRIEADIDCGNCSMTQDEANYIEQEITKLIEDRGMKIKKILVTN